MRGSYNGGHPVWVVAILPVAQLRYLLTWSNWLVGNSAFSVGKCALCSSKSRHRALRLYNGSMTILYYKF